MIHQGHLEVTTDDVRRVYELRPLEWVALTADKVEITLHDAWVHVKVDTWESLCRG